MGNETVELVKLMGQRFIQRKDAKAMQNPDGSWTPIKIKDELQPFAMADFEDHLSGKRTLGHYLVDPDGNCKLFAFDIDIRKHLIEPPKNAPADWQPSPTWYLDYGYEGEGDFPKIECDLRAAWNEPDHPSHPYIKTILHHIALGLAHRSYRILKESRPVSIAYSGSKGLHVYVFTGSISADKAIKAADGILQGVGWHPSRGNNFYRHNVDPLDDYSNFEIEVFPKQATVRENGGLGNLMALPLGVNRRTGHDKYFCDMRCGPTHGWGMKDPVRAMQGDLPWE